MQFEITKTKKGYRLQVTHNGATWPMFAYSYRAAQYLQERVRAILERRDGENYQQVRAEAMKKLHPWRQQNLKRLY
jgi:hypothetical protein